MIGAVLTHQQPLQQIIGVYYILQDIVLLSQFFYYTRVYHRAILMTGSTIVVPVFLFGFFGISQFWLPSSVSIAQPAETYSINRRSVKLSMNSALNRTL